MQLAVFAMVVALFILEIDMENNLQLQELVVLMMTVEQITNL